MIIYIDWIIPKRYDAYTFWPFIFIRPTSKNDVGLHEHELVHFKEAAWNPVWGLRYKFSKKFRLAAEARAYRRQMEFGMSEDLAAYYLVKNYKLNISFEDAKAALRAA